MTTQRDRLAAVLLETDDMAPDWVRDDPDAATMLWSWDDRSANDWADALLARGVRVVDADTLATAFAKADVTLYEAGKWRGLNERTDAETILAALDAEVNG